MGSSMFQLLLLQSTEFLLKMGERFCPNQEVVQYYEDPRSSLYRDKTKLVKSIYFAYDVGNPEKQKRMENMVNKGLDDIGDAI